MKKTAFQTLRVVLISFSHFVHDLYSSFLPPLLPLIIEKLSLTLSQAGLLSFVMQVPDRKKITQTVDSGEYYAQNQ